MEKARAAVYEGPGKIIVREFPLSQIGEDGILLEVKVAGVDGSDIKIVHGEISPAQSVGTVGYG